MLSFLPLQVQLALNHVTKDSLCEIRLRQNCPVSVLLNDRYHYLGKNGLETSPTNALTLSNEEIQEIIYKACNGSIYAVQEQINQLFITTVKGVRIGLAGSIVYQQNNITAVKDITSLCIRIPHEIKDCAKKMFECCFKKEIYNTLLLSPPGQGKTTMLKDLIYQISSQYPQMVVLVLDERGELYSDRNLYNVDYIRFSPKLIGLPLAIRSMRPNIIFTDEIQENELDEIVKYMNYGIKIIASAHFEGKIENCKFTKFDRYVMLPLLFSDRAVQVYDQDFNLL